MKALALSPRPKPLASGLRPLPLGLLYYPGVRCPACGGRSFDVGRVTAECARCDGALVLADPRPFSPEENQNG